MQLQLETFLLYRTHQHASEVGTLNEQLYININLRKTSLFHIPYGKLSVTREMCKKTAISRKGLGLPIVLHFIQSCLLWKERGWACRDTSRSAIGRWPERRQRHLHSFDCSATQRDLDYPSVMSDAIRYEWAYGLTFRKVRQQHAHSFVRKD